MKREMIMEINKVVAQKELSFIGGKPKVTEFWDDFNNRKVDILKCVNIPQKGIQTCATIGLNDTDIGLVSNEKSLRVELIGASDILIEKYENIIASVAFAIMESGKCFPGCIIQNVIQQYIPECEMKHILLTDPFLWEGAKSFTIDGINVAWLMLVPIAEEEYQYASEKGVEELELLFEAKGIDIYNIYRKVVL